MQKTHLRDRYLPQWLIAFKASSAAALVARVLLRQRRLWCANQALRDIAVALIDVRAEFEAPVAVDERRLVDDEDRHRLRQAAPAGRAEVDILGDVVLGDPEQQR